MGIMEKREKMIADGLQNATDTQNEAKQLKADYEKLKNGTKTLADLKSYFWNGNRDCYVLGLEGSKSYAENIKGNVN